ncbi:MAG: hypothetical protein K6A40_08955 [Solobacterium sp.]|nr:hypothetical protein [Solobacterium sp.]
MTKILFLGNSHTYMNDMPFLFKEVFERSCREVCDVTMLAFSGRDLEWHRKEYFSLRFALLYGNYDYCVIQQAAHPFPEKSTTMENGRKIIDLCRRTGTIPVLYMTWAEKAYPENQKKMINVYTALAEETGAMLAKAGIVWEAVRKEAPQIDLFFKDGEHASPYGDLLIASVLCRTLRRNVQLKAPARLIDFHVHFENEFPEASFGDDRFFTPDPEAVDTILRMVTELI